ncbi:MAG: FG-GAP-like repeat-containing protein [bacterium]
MKTTNFYSIAFIAVLAVFVAGCAGKKECSTDTQCKAGSFCNEGKCEKFQSDDYKIVFENIEDGATITSAQDLDLSVDGIQIDVHLALKEAKRGLKDGAAVALKIKKGNSETLFNGKFLSGKAVFSQVTLPEGEVVLSAYLEQNPAEKSIITVNVLKMDIVMFYFKGDNTDAKIPLENATISDEDDTDLNPENGIQLNFIAKTSGIDEGGAVEIIFPQIDKEEKVKKGAVGGDGTVVFENVTIPPLANVVMTVVSGEYSKNVEFKVSSKAFCGFLLNIENNAVFGKKDDANSSLSGLQYDLVISEITGCAKGSRVSIYVDTDESSEPQTSFTISSSQVEERITFEKSTSAEDKKEFLVVIEDKANNMMGAKSIEGLIVDLDDPFVEVSFPEVGAELNMSHDLDSGSPGLQVKIEGNSNDNVTAPVSVELKLGETVIANFEEVDGIFEHIQTFTQSIPAAVLTVSVTDGAGNSTEETIPFSVNIDADLEFYSVCGVTGSDIIDGMWLNASHDLEPLTELLQCEVIVKVKEGAGVTNVTLKAGSGDEVSKEIEEEGFATFDLSLAETTSGIKLDAKSFIGETLFGENNLTVRVDTVIPVTTLNNSLLLGNGGKTNSENMVFEFDCVSEHSCSFNTLIDDEISAVYSADKERAFTGLSSGTHSFKVTAKDAAGNIGSQLVFEWTVDSDKPDTVITSHPGAGTNKDFALFTFESTKPGEDSTFFCKLEKEGVPLIPDDGTFEECALGKRDYFELEEGNYRFLVKAGDSLGNEDPSPAEHVWVIGSDAPVTTIDVVVPADAITSVTEIAFTYSASIDSTFKCRLEKEGTAVEDWTDCSLGTKTYSSLDDGTHIFLVKATTIYGVEESCPATHIWTVDTVKPKVKFLAKPSKLSPYTEGTFLFECVGESGPCDFTCQFDSAPVDCAIGHYSFAGIEGGSHSFSVVATDLAGNASVIVTSDTDLYQNSYEWMVNPAALGVQITSKPSLITKLSDATFEFESNKAATFECKIDEEEYTPCYSPFGYSGLDDGEHIFTVKASFAEEINFASYTWLIDSLSPVVTVTSAQDNPTNKTGAIIYFSANEPASFECKLSTETEWITCSSPKIYPAGTFGVEGSVQDYTFEVRAKDKAGNIGESSYSWSVDLQIPAISWVSPLPKSDGRVIVGKADNIYGNDETNYAIKIRVNISGSDVGQPINVEGFKTPPGYSIVSVDTVSPRNYDLTVGLQSGARVNNPLTISVSDNAGNFASVTKVVVVNTQMPVITWAFPENNYKFLSTTPAPSFVFNVWNALPGTLIELVNEETSEVVGTATAVGTTGTQEHISIKPDLEDRCAPYKFYATFFDDDEGIRYYTNSTDNIDLKTSRSFTVDKMAAVIGEIEIQGIDAIDRILNRDDNLNSNPDGGMQTEITVSISDENNSSDTNRTVKIFTNNGSGEPETLIATLNKQGNIAEFKNVPLSENHHTLKVEVSDCSGNISSKTLLPIFVDTVAPELTVTAPRGSASNWRWLTAVDDPTLGAIDSSGNFTNIEMTIESSEQLDDFVEVIHTSFDYENDLNYQNNISASATLGTNSVTVALPNLEYAKHKFVVTVEDLAGNKATAGDETFYEVDVIIPQISFEDLNDGDEFDTDMNLEKSGFQIIAKLIVSDVEPTSTYLLKALPIVSHGGDIDPGRDELLWSGTASSDSTIVRDITLGNGWWRLSATIKDNHENQSSTEEIDINAVVSTPSITLKKSFDYDLGEGPVIQGEESSPAWMSPSDIECIDDLCTTTIEVWTDAPAGSTAYISINDGVEISKTTAGGSSQSYAEFEIELDKSLPLNKVAVKLVSTTLAESEALYYIKIDETVPMLTLINPLPCSTEEVCRRLDLSDDLATDYIELAELGYGYEDDSVAGGVLNFKESGKIVFKVEGATEGSVEIKTVAGITNRTAPISYNSSEDYYYADFSTMTVADSNEFGQTDYDLVFKVTETPSGAVSRFLIKLHVNLKKPVGIDIAGKVSTFKKEGKVKVDWDAISGNNSTFGVLPGAVYRYDLRYENYNSSCSIESNFKNAKIPLETIAGQIPDSVATGEMSYQFFVNRINNGGSGSSFKEADVHHNGNKYCFAIAAVDAVYASDGTLLAENFGTILPNDTGEMKMEWETIQETYLDYHSIIIRNLGDLDGDGLDDFVVADGFRSSIAGAEDFAGHLKIYFSKKETTFEKTGADWDGLGQGVSSKADFNGDGILDFAYTNVYGEVFIHYGGQGGLSLYSSVTFTAKDDSEDVYRTMATGDYNGDGCDDIAISAPNAGGGNKGEVYIYFGRGDNCFSTNEFSGENPDVTFVGTDNDELGRAEIYAVGDLNNDGRTDFALPSAKEKIFIAYGGSSGGTAVYDYSGFKPGVGRRISYGDFNGDSFSDLVIADNDKIHIYFGSSTGISAASSLTISEIDMLNYNHPSSVTTFAKVIPAAMTDINGDGISDLVLGLERGLLFYETHLGELSRTPSVFDSNFLSESPFVKLLMANHGIVYCNNDDNDGSCRILKYGE